MADLTLSVPAARDHFGTHDWYLRCRHLLAVRARFARRQRFRRFATDRVRNGADGWMLALPQSRHGG